MDWPVTARTTVPHIRQTVADRELETWLVVDLSPSMDFGTALTEKRELVLAAHHRGRPPDRARRQPGRRGRRQRRRTTYVDPGPGRARARPAPDAPHRARRRGPTQAGRNDLAAHARVAAPAAAPARAGRGGVGLPRQPAPRRRRPPPPWERPLRGLSDRHQLLGRRGARPARARAAGRRPGHLRRHRDRTSARGADVRPPACAAQYAAAAGQQRERIATALRHAGAAHLQLRTDRDWITDVVRFVIARRRFVVGAVGAGVR